MSMILSSKMFFINGKDGIPLDEIKNWFDSVERGEDCRLILKLQTAGDSRFRKQPLKDRLEGLAAGRIAEKKPAVWEKGEYRFDFIKGEYLWKKEAVYITAGEALYLFGKLILGCGFDTAPYYKNNMRRRLGGGFLKGII